VATAVATPGTVAARCAMLPPSPRPPAIGLLEIEHPTGFFTVEMEVVADGACISVRRSALLRTARKLMSGMVYVPSTAWPDRR